MDVLDRLEPITLAKMTQSALMDRSELKYVFPEALLPAILAALHGSYRVLTVAGRRQCSYRTLYFDTPDLALYHRHHAGAPDRYKIRSREYVDSHTAFFEVKHRTPDHRTQKSRIPTPGFVTAPSVCAAEFLTSTSPYSAGELCASLWNHYTRITLVSVTRPERVTVDINLEFVREQDWITLPGIVIAEVKYDGDAHGSPFVAAMRNRGIRGTGFSKYCVGVSFLRDDVKHNRFKSKHLLIERLMHGASHGIH